MICKNALNNLNIFDTLSQLIKVYFPIKLSAQQKKILTQSQY